MRDAGGPSVQRPHDRRPVRAAGGEKAPVRRKGHAVDIILVAALLGERGPALCVPHDQRPGVVDGGQPAPIGRVGHAVDPGAVLFEDQRFLGEGERTTTDIIAGLTSVIDRRTTAQLNLSFGIANGYMTDPYKVFSIVDANGVEWDQYFEGRPDSRTRWSITAKLNHMTFPGNNGMHLTYRYYSDDWDIKSHTLDYAHRFIFGNADYLEPRIRLYSQSKAEFYQNAFFAAPGSTPNLPEFLSADYRLDDMSSGTVGLTYGVRFGPNADLRTRLEYLCQTFDNSTFDTNKALIFNISYGKRF